MATSTSSVATSTTIPVNNISIIEPPRLQPLLFPQLDADGSNYLLWARTAKAHIYADGLSDSIAFDDQTTVSTTIPPGTTWKILLLLRCHLIPTLQH